MAANQPVRPAAQFASRHHRDIAGSIQPQEQNQQSDTNRQFMGLRDMQTTQESTVISQVIITIGIVHFSLGLAMGALVGASLFILTSQRRAIVECGVFHLGFHHWPVWRPKPGRRLEQIAALFT